MQETGPQAHHDPFGRDGRERLLRRLAGTDAGALPATVAVFGLLGAVTADLWLWVAIVYGLPDAAVLVPLVSAVAHHLPRRWLTTVAAIGLVTAARAAPALVWLEQRPPAPHDYVVVDDTQELRATFRDARGLADPIAGEFDELAGQGRARLDQENWIEVADRIRKRYLGDHA